jgi:hypothetical protein
MTKVFFDTEFTGCHKDTTLISIGCVSEDGRKFYAELTDYDREQVDGWVRNNVLSNLRYSGIEHDTIVAKGAETGWQVVGQCSWVAKELREWFAQFDQVEMWGDCLTYDWLLFCDLFGGPSGIPNNLFYIPFDLATLLKLKGIDPDVNREEFAGQHDVSQKHNALSDAMVTACCYEQACAAS